MTATTGPAELTGQTQWRRRLATPIREFIATQNSSAIVLLAATVAALVWANSPWSATYERVWHTELALHLGAKDLTLDLRHWINDGLMAFFFFVVGLEIRREFDMGELRDRRRLATPVLAAFGGMTAPALIYLAINASSGSARGWGIVMGTDTAFALGILTLVGGAATRVRTFLLTLVIVDDIVALAVIALAYTGQVSAPALTVAVALYGVILVLRQQGVQNGIPYFLVGSAMWLATLASGVHATIAGVAVGLLAFARPPSSSDLRDAGNQWRLFREQPSPEYARSASRRLATSISPNERLQYLFHPWTSYVIVPLFALANAGVHIDGEVLRHAASSSVTIGIVAGLVVGKPLGILTLTWFATRRRGFPLTVPWPKLAGAATVAGIGFTVSLLIADISFEGQELEDAKIGVLAASVIASLLAWAVFTVVKRLPERIATAGVDRLADPLVDLVGELDPDVDHVRGRADAPVVLVEYGDFECPYCAEAAGAIDALRARFGDDLAFVFRHLPLEDVHEHARFAAEAAEAAAEQGRFWEMYDLLIGDGVQLKYRDVVRYSDELGLDSERFASDVTSQSHAWRIDRDVASAEESGVAGTPTFFVNGRRYRGPYDLASLSAAVEVARRTARAANGFRS